MCLALFAAWLLAAGSGAVGEELQPKEPIAPIVAAPSGDPKRVQLGRRLFDDVRLSQDRSQSCATCHPLDRGGMDGQALAPNDDGTPLQRNTPTVFNASLNATLNWDGGAPNLEEHTDRLLRNLMGITWEELVDRLRADRAYVAAFAQAYRDGLVRDNVRNALTEFERSLVTPRARFDRYLQGDATALTTGEKDGYRLFKFYGCASCHQGVNAGGNMFQKFGVFGTIPPSASGVRDPGRLLITKAPRDEHVFRVPSLRNVALTAPYFHDGRAATLEKAVETMGEAQLGRKLRANEIASIVEFLKTLTGEYQGRLLMVPRSEAR